jgi:hypothetical protein
VPSRDYGYDESAGRGSGARSGVRVFVDERGIVYAVDRITGGLYVLEMTL